MRHAVKVAGKTEFVTCHSGFKDFGLSRLLQDKYYTASRKTFPIKVTIEQFEWSSSI